MNADTFVQFIDFLVVVTKASYFSLACYAIVGIIFQAVTLICESIAVDLADLIATVTNFDVVVLADTLTIGIGCEILATNLLTDTIPSTIIAIPS